jgi:hypothetical protein
MKLEFFRQIFRKYSNIKFYENPLVGAELFHADSRTGRQAGRQADRQAGRQTDRYDEVSSLFSQFCDLAEQPQQAFVLHSVMHLQEMKRKTTGNCDNVKNHF